MAALFFAVLFVALQLVATRLYAATLYDNTDTTQPPVSELEMARLIFDHNLQSTWGPGRPWWAIDWPDAEQHFTDGVMRYTNIEIAQDSRHIRLTDRAIFDYPWLFVQQVGRWQLSKAEIQQLREYLLRGGFMVVDDFHGPTQWEVFSGVMRQALPEFAIVDIPTGDELLHVLYELEQRTQIPGRRHLYYGAGGTVVEMPHSPPQWRGIYDNKNRLMVAINFNMDMGDSWEHADDPVYPVSMTSLGYRFGINYLIYAMTH
ncbi:MAG: DUF4159 domain-containing protein [Pseudomonadota bacterium]